MFGSHDGNRGGIVNENFWYPREPQRFLTDTQWCDAATEVAHNRLIETYYALGRPIKDDKDRICNIGKIKDVDYQRVRGNLVELGWKFENGELRHKRIEQTMAKMDAERTAKIAGSALGVERRRQLGQLPKEPMDEPMVNPSVEPKGYPSVNLTTTTTIATTKDIDKEIQKGCPMSEILEAWNAKAPVKCLVVSDARRHKLATRWNDHFFRDNWKEAIEKISLSDFCNGKSDRGWKASFDWFLQPDTVVKVVEGKYSARPKVKNYAP
jgi:uncharacterized protein YdaU (DUF1376 family)